jgi:tetratricopeptide (TPR) repeat protein
MHLAWYYFIQNNTKQYNFYVERIALRGNDQVDNDLEALSFAAKKQKPDLALLKARLLFDGGYYERAISELEGYSSANVKNNLEHTYRLARIYHNQGKPDEAIRYYKTTIKEGEKLPYYYAANSALQLGLIYEKRKDYVQARIYFSKVLDMDFDEYQFSIKNKAQAGMNRIKGKS